MMGSETFIIVAFMCSENSTPEERASSICASRNARRAATSMKVLSTISPASTGTESLSIDTVPSIASCSIRSDVSAAIVTDCSFERKSPDDMVATWLSDPAVHAPIECGWLRAYSLTALGARRSEFPSRRTGLTAEPFTRSKRARMSRSSSVDGLSG